MSDSRIGESNDYREVPSHYVNLHKDVRSR